MCNFQVVNNNGKVIALHITNVGCRFVGDALSRREVARSAAKAAKRKFISDRNIAPKSYTGAGFKFFTPKSLKSGARYTLTNN